MKNLVFLIYILSLSGAIAQQSFTLQEAVQQVLENHPAMKQAEAAQVQQRYARVAAVEVPKTEISYMRGQFNSFYENDNNITISQSLPFPTVWSSRRNLAKAAGRVADWRMEAVRHELVFQVKTLFQQWLYATERNRLLTQQDSVFTELMNAAERRYSAGESALIEKMAVQARLHEIRNQRRQNVAAIYATQTQLQLLMQLQVMPEIQGIFEPLAITDTAATIGANPLVRLWKNETEMASLEKKTKVSEALPDLSVSYFNQTLVGFHNVDGTEQYVGSDDRLDGFIIGVSIPLWFGTHAGRIKAAQANQLSVSYREQANTLELESELVRTQRNLESNRRDLLYYHERALPNAALLEEQSVVSYQKGAIDHTTLLLNLEQVLTIRQNYLQAIFEFNNSVLKLEYLRGEVI